MVSLAFLPSLSSMADEAVAIFNSKFEIPGLGLCAQSSFLCLVRILRNIS